MSEDISSSDQKNVVENRDKSKRLHVGKRGLLTVRNTHVSLPPPVFASPDTSLWPAGMQNTIRCVSRRISLFVCHYPDILT